MDTFKLGKIKQNIKDLGLDGIIVDSRQNVFYASGFTGYDDALLIITPDSQHIITDSRYTVQVKQQCPDFEFTETYKHNTEAIAKIIKEKKLHRVGFEEKRATVKEYNDIYRKVGIDELVPVSEMFAELRQIKTSEETETIAKACDIAGKALEETLNYIKPGVKETEIAARLEFEMRLRGAEKPSFDTVVASGIRGSMPHGTATDKLIEPGDAVTIDFGAVYNGLCSDCTRTVFVGSVGNEKIREIYDIVYKAQTTAIEKFRIGMEARELDKIARDIITDAGYGKEFGHSTGHGVGIDIHEGVAVSTKSTQKLTEGLVFSVEPGIYVEGLGGVRIEDLVTPVNGKLRILTKNPGKNIIIV